jgi:ribonuclease P protein component
VGSAVVRNRLRRRLRAILADAGTMAPGAYLVAVGPEAVAFSHEELKATVRAALSAATGDAGAGAGKETT